MIPYGEADAVHPVAGYRFAVKVKKDNITSKDQLPNGTICKVTNTSASGGYNTYTKAAFEDDGSLINIFAPTSENLSDEREIKIKWETGDFTTYTFDLSGTTLQPVYSITKSVTHGTASGDTQILGGKTASVTIAPSTGYVLPSTVTVTGATHSYNATTGVIILSNPTGNVTITAVCEEETTFTKFSLGDTVSKIKFDTNLSVAEVVAILEDLTYEDDPTYEDGVINLLDTEGTREDNGVLYAMKVPNVEDAYVILAAPNNASETVILFSSVADAEQEITQGFQNLNDDVSFDVNWTIDHIYQGTVWNDGMLVGE